MTEPVETVVIPGSTRLSAKGARFIGDSDPAERLQVSIYARQNPAGATLRTRAQQEAEKLPGDRKPLSKEDFVKAFGAASEDIENISKWATASGLTVVAKNAGRRLVSVEGTADAFNRALRTKLGSYEYPGRERFRGREGPLSVPAELAGVIEGVFGLDTRHVGHARIRRRNVAMEPHEKVSHSKTAKAASSPSTQAAQWPGTFFPTQLAHLYSYPPDLSGDKQNIAVFAFNGTDPDPRGGYSLAALQTYFDSVLGGKTPAITDVVIAGPGNKPGPDTQASSARGDSTGEVMLDLCVVGALAPSAHIFVYFTEFTSKGWVDALTDAISGDNGISVISISYGNPEDDPHGAWTSMGVRLVNQTFQASIAKQITICCASGDDGSSDQSTRGAHTDFPASSPYVLGVGGTKVVATSGAMPTITSESVWNETLSDEGAGGGGVSAIFTKPVFQNNVNVPPSANPPHRIGRGVPDVSAVADPETGVVVMRIDGKHLEPIGGTSASAPLWAALIARLNQGLGAPCGYLNPILYARCATNVLRDITVGNNGAYSATTGWDACTGLGSPNGQRLLSALSSPS